MVVTGGLPSPKRTSSSTQPTTSQQESIRRNVINQLNIRGEAVEYNETTDERERYLKEETKRRDVAFEEYTRMNEEEKRLALGEMEKKERKWIEARISKEELGMKTSRKTDRTPEVRSKTETRGEIRSWFKDISPTNPIRVMNQEVYNKTEVDKATGSEVIEKLEELIHVLIQEFDDETMPTEFAYLETINETLTEFKLNLGISKSWNPLSETCSYSKITDATERVVKKWLGPIEVEQVQIQYLDLSNLSSRQRLVGPVVYMIQKWCNLMEKAIRDKDNSDSNTDGEEKMEIATRLQYLNQRSRQLVTTLSSATQSAAMVKEMVEMDSPEAEQWSARPPPHQHASVFKDHSRSSGVMSLPNEPTKAMLTLHAHAVKTRKDLSEAIKKQTWQEGVSLASVLSMHTYERELAKNQYMLNTAWCDDLKLFSISRETTLT